MLRNERAGLTCNMLAIRPGTLLNSLIISFLSPFRMHHMPLLLHSMCNSYWLCIRNPRMQMQVEEAVSDNQEQNKADLQ
jgi:hypothetical protein